MQTTRWSRANASSGRLASRALGAALIPLVAAASATGQGCPGDVDGNGIVRGDDLTVLLSDWGGPAGAKLDADFNDDGIVDGADLTVMLGNWGSCVTVPDWATVIEPQPNPSVVTNASLRDKIAGTGLPWRVVDTATGIEMLLIPPGIYDMGAISDDALAFSDEFPRHQVTISQPFYMGRYEVTQAQFFAAMGYNPSFFGGASDGVDPTLPVETVSYFEAGDFLNATGMRFPTEAEWEYACRAGTTAPTSAGAGQTLADIAWYTVNSGWETRPVGTRAANALGLHDMFGNVWEWIGDWYDAIYYSTSPSVDPKGPQFGFFRVLRGGSWYAPVSNCRSSFRGAMYPEAQLGDTGFRVVREP